jgi:hypothetical protein
MPDKSAERRQHQRHRDADSHRNGIGQPFRFVVLVAKHLANLADQACGFLFARQLSTIINSGPIARALTPGKVHKFTRWCIEPAHSFSMSGRRPSVSTVRRHSQPLLAKDDRYGNCCDRASQHGETEYTQN